MTRFRTTPLDDGRGQLTTLHAGDGPLPVRLLLERWRDDPAFRERFTAELAAFPAPAFRWECPPLTAGTLDRPAEFVLLDAPEIELPPDPAPFAEHFDDSPVVAFPNLGGDGLMIAPTPRGPDAAYAHLGPFLRGAPEEQVHALWQAVAEAVLTRAGDRPLWLSTAGGGVAWLHVRLDSRPKYYAHVPYRTPDGPGPTPHRTVVVGGLTLPELLLELERNAVSTNEAGRQLLASDRLVLPAQPLAVETVELSVEQLGFPHGAPYAAVVERATELGLKPCPLALAPFLRLQHLRQPEGARGEPDRRNRAPAGALTVASEWRAEDEAAPRGFYLRRIQGVLWLRGYRASSDHVWDAEDRLVFAAAESPAPPPPCRRSGGGA